MKQFLLLITLLPLIFARCSTAAPAPAPSPTTVQILPTSSPPHDSQQDLTSPTFGLTYYSPDGNRYIQGVANIPNISPIKIQLAGTPTWVTAAADQDSSYWVVALENGQIQAFRLQGDHIEEIDISPNFLDPGQPSAITLSQNSLSLLAYPIDSPYSNSHPILLSNASIFSLTESAFSDQAFTPLPDTRPLVNEHDQILILTDPTTIYGHNVLGDDLEAASVSLIDLKPEIQITKLITMSSDVVIEGIMPIWVDLDNDDIREIIITQSNSSQGAQIMVYDQNGNIFAEGRPIGQGYRWRHQIAVAPFGPNNELELVDVLTPHIGGVVEFFQITEQRLEIVAQVEGFTSHVIGTRNLDMALAGDFDNDQRIELLLPDQSRTSLGAIQRIENGAIVDWQIPLTGTLTTNIAAVAINSDTFAVGVGLNSNQLWIWLP